MPSNFACLHEAVLAKAGRRSKPAKPTAWVQVFKKARFLEMPIVYFYF